MSSLDIWLPAIGEAFGFLAEFGFSLQKDEIVNSALLGQSIKLSFSAKAGFRKVNVLYYPGSSEFVESVTISVADNRGRSFLLRDFLKLDGKEGLFVNFVGDRLLVTGEQLIKRAAGTFKEICRTELKPILTGAAWIDVPFDWRGYR